MTASRQTILLIEDDEDVRETIIDTLRDEGFAADGVEDGVAALEWLTARTEKPALILLDLMMPRMSGAELRERLLQDSVLSQIPVVILSADGYLATKNKALRTSGYLRKPLRLVDLLEVARRYTESGQLTGV